MMGGSRAWCEQYDIPIKMFKQEDGSGEDTIKKDEDENGWLRM